MKQCLYRAWKAWKMDYFYKSQGKPGRVREFFVNFIQVRENKSFSPHVINSLHDC